MASGASPVDRVTVPLRKGTRSLQCPPCQYSVKAGPCSSSQAHTKLVPRLSLPRAVRHWAQRRGILRELPQNQEEEQGEEGEAQEEGAAEEDATRVTIAVSTGANNSGSFTPGASNSYSLSTSASNSGSLSTSASNSGSLSTSASNSGSLSTSASNSGSLSTGASEFSSTNPCPSTTAAGSTDATDHTSASGTGKPPPKLPPPPPPSPPPSRAPAPSPSPAPSDVSPPLPLNTSSCGVCGASYTGDVGDTLSSLSKTCNVDLGLLQEANPGVDVAAGRTVSVPCTGTDPADCGPCGAFYFVKEEDSFDAIAAKCSLPAQDLHEANQDLILAADGGPELYPGQYISVPCRQPQLARSTRGCGDCGLFYRARAGDIVDGAAYFCRVSDEGLLAANPALRNASSELEQGQLISVPCFGESSRQCGLCGASYTPEEFESLAAVSAKCRTPGLEAANPGAASELGPGSPPLIVPCGTSLSPKCSPCSPEVRINDSSLDAMAKLCQVPAELLLYANGILPVQAEAPLRLGQNLSVPCAKLPAASSACSICGSSFLVTEPLHVPALALACGIDEEEVYTKNNLSKSAIVEPDSVLQLPCEQPAVGCGPCGVGYFPVEDEELAAVAVKCRVYPNVIREENPNIVDSSAPLFDKALTMPCKITVPDAGLSLGPPRYVGDTMPLLLASGALALLHLLG